MNHLYNVYHNRRSLHGSTLVCAPWNHWNKMLQLVAMRTKKGETLNKSYTQIVNTHYKKGWSFTNPRTLKNVFLNFSCIFISFESDIIMVETRKESMNTTSMKRRTSTQTIVVESLGEFIEVLEVVTSLETFGKWNLLKQCKAFV